MLLKGDEACNPIFAPIALPCGRTLRNRLVKVALYEHLAKLFGGPPNRYHLDLYSKWSAHDWGMIFTGNVQVSPHHLCLARDIVLPRQLSAENLRSFEALATAIHGERDDKPMAIMQLSHAGRQSPNILGGRLPFVAPLGPSSIRLGSSLTNHGFISDLLHRLLFQVPQAMSSADIDDVVEAFVRGAKLAAQTGFDGVELHAAHGYLLAQFMSPKANARTDEYSCSPSNALRLLSRIVFETRAVVPSDFILGLKINAADYADSSTPALDHVRTIASWGSIDFIEISGGDYEKPDFLSASASASLRQALFADFARDALRTVAPLPRAPLILLTGGLAAPAQLHSALSARHAHLLGLGRSAVLRPDLPQLLHDAPPYATAPFAPPPDLRIGGAWVLQRLPRIRLLGAGVAMAWYVVALRRLAAVGPAVVPPDYAVGGAGGILWMWVWFGPEVEVLGMTWLYALVLGVAAAVAGLWGVSGF
ncbi:hypothetical protein B0H15DRAFT_871985 [Mycena belliarum]|uniref:NADH:flavin oxidoreductase/NADH oxidase N-terminal domain-containing protein n=1 Tax=Mycena belliarum TaxID=1033014 RepID=A0AAD6TMV7_9AGAR|nr:hypothetical protein B0H15DRAFT_871985 [Mycena belliae]